MERSLKIIVLASLWIFNIVPAHATGPWFDLFIGVGGIITGQVFDGQKSKAEDHARGYESVEKDYRWSANVNLASSNYSQGVADLEEYYLGRTEAYWEYQNAANAYYAESERENGEANRFSSMKIESLKDAKLYQGVSITSYAIGTIFTIRAIVIFVKQAIEREEANDKKKKISILQGFDVKPTNEMDGVQIAYSWKY